MTQDQITQAKALLSSYGHSVTTAEVVRIAELICAQPVK